MYYSIPFVFTESKRGDSFPFLSFPTFFRLFCIIFRARECGFCVLFLFFCFPLYLIFPLSLFLSLAAIIFNNVVLLVFCFFIFSLRSAGSTMLLFILTGTLHLLLFTYKYIFIFIIYIFSLNFKFNSNTHITLCFAIKFV